jgi:Ca-activated chloride channel homolog
MNFLNSPALILLILIPCFSLFWFARTWVASNLLAKIGDSELVTALLSQIDTRRRKIKAVLWASGLVCLILAMARPTFGTEIEVVQPVGAEIALVIDVSLSMDAQDVLPSRLERAKFDLQELATRLEGNAIGILIFAKESFPYMPMTVDTDATNIFLRNLSTNALTVQGTGIANALLQASQLFDDNPETPSLIVLVSDGENHEGDLNEATTTLNQLGIAVYTLGYGTSDGGIIPLYDIQGNLLGSKADSTGAIVITRLDETVLQNIATQTNANYLQMTNNTDITPLVNALTEAGQGELSEQIQERPIEQFSWFVLVALLCLTLVILLPETR